MTYIQHTARYISKSVLHNSYINFTHFWTLFPHLAHFFEVTMEGHLIDTDFEHFIILSEVVHHMHSFYIPNVQGLDYFIRGARAIIKI